jgi:parvulin-like peptidyl-prolyl isomerase
MKKLIREPLVHFLLLGAVLFGVYAALNKGEAPAQEDIVVSAGQIENLAGTFARAWQRPPTAVELKAQIDQYVKEEILSREAVKLGLDQNDTVIRRRLQQKMEFIAEDFAASEPTETELADYLAQHPGQFAQEQRFTFRQVFLNPQKRGDQLEAEAATLLARLKQEGTNADASALGDSVLLPGEFTDEPQGAVASQFGPEFAVGLAKVKPGEWTGPLQSGYGAHLVFVAQRRESRMPELAEVRDSVKRELMNTRRLAANDKFLESLLARYRVKIESPTVEPSSQANATAMNR